MLRRVLISETIQLYIHVLNGDRYRPHIIQGNQTSLPP
jgi:hypothetical protein